jgi:hypothetical protein
LLVDISSFSVFATAFDQDMPLWGNVRAHIMNKGMVRSYLQSILAGETLVTMTARERLNRQMDALMALQVVIAVEALWALIALEGTVIMRRLLSLMRVVVVHMLQAGRVSTVEVDQSLWQTSHQHWRTIWIVEI